MGGFENFEAGGARHVLQRPEGVAPVVHQVLVVDVVQVRPRRHFEVGDAARFEHAKNMTERRRVVVNVLQHIQRRDRFDRRVRQRTFAEIKLQQRHARQTPRQRLQGRGDEIRANQFRFGPPRADFFKQEPRRTADIQNDEAPPRREMFEGLDGQRAGSAVDGMGRTGFRFVHLRQLGTPVAVRRLVAKHVLRLAADEELTPVPLWRHRRAGQRRPGKLPQKLAHGGGGVMPSRRAGALRPAKWPARPVRRRPGPSPDATGAVHK